VSEKSVKTVESRRYQRMVVPEGFGIRVSGRENGNVLEGIASVIGLGGMFCRTNDRLSPGTNLILRMTWAASSFEAECSVRHANEQGMGIEFLHFRPEDRQKLERLLFRLQS